MFIHLRNRQSNGAVPAFFVLLLVLIVAAGAPVAAEEPDDATAAMSATAPPGGMGMMKRPCKKKMGMGGRDKGGMMGHKHQGKGAGPESWKASLTDAQRQEIKALKVAHMKITLPLKMRIKAAKAELVALATADPVDQAAVEAKIDDLLWHKRLKLIEKYRFMAAKRQVLTPDQRLDFDMAAMKRVKHGGKGGHGRRH